MTGYLNPPFDPRMTRIGSRHTPGGRNLQRGRLQFADFGIRFLYNPVSVSVSHFLNPYVNPSIAVKQNTAANAVGGVGLGMGSSAFSLLFDRTYEVWDGKGLAGTYGCYVDIIAFYEATGITSSASSSSTSKTQKGPNPLEPPKTTTTTTKYWHLFPTNGLSPNAMVDAYIGPKLKFHGYIDSLSITYTHFSAAMIPVRCEVDLDITWVLGGDKGVNPKYGKPTTDNSLHGNGKGGGKGKGKSGGHKGKNPVGKSPAGKPPQPGAGFHR